MSKRYHRQRRGAVAPAGVGVGHQRLLYCLKKYIGRKISREYRRVSRRLSEAGINHA